jgi:hypothetical protein
MLKKHHPTYVDGVDHIKWQMLGDFDGITLQTKGVISRLHIISRWTSRISRGKKPTLEPSKWCSPHHQVISKISS